VREHTPGPPTTTAERVATALGSRVVAARAATGGYSSAERLVIELADGRSVFAKCGHEPLIAQLLEVERRFYESLQAAFVPAFIAYLSDPPPVLVLEDLSAGDWPPPWSEGAVDAVLRMLEHVRATPPPAHVPRVEDDRERLTDGWRRIAADPAPFLSLGVCSETWLEAALEALTRATEAAPIEGDALLHLDVRSDNVCIRDRSAVLVDWNQACVGNPLLDVAAWLPSLETEAGPPPDDVLPNCPPGFASLLAGFFGARAGLPPPETAPFVRRLQLAQLRVALPWAARLLGVPEPEPR
jgi:Phosphotransferase enzyme family